MGAVAAGITMVATALIAGWLLWRAGQGERLVEESRGWASVKATITSSRIRKASQGKRWPSIRYSYDAHGQTFEGTRITFLDTNKSKKRCDEIVARYHAGLVLPVWYDPADPSYAVIERNANSGFFRRIALIVGLSGLVTALIMGAVL